MGADSRLSRFLRFSLWLLVGLFIFLAVDLSVRESPQMVDVQWIPHSIAHWADQTENDAVRTAVPFVGLAALTILLTPPRAHRSIHFLWIRRLVLLFAWMALAVVVEGAQLWLPHRNASWLDVLWGWGGVGAGTLAGLGLRGLIALCR